MQPACQANRIDSAVQERSTRNIAHDRCERQRHGDVDFERQSQPRETGRCDTNDREGCALDAKGATDSCRIAVEVSLPERVPDDRDRRGVLGVDAHVCVREQPPGDGPNPELGKVVARDRRNIAAGSDIVNFDIDNAVRGPANQRRQALLAFCDRSEHREGKRPIRRRTRDPRKRNQRGRFAYRQVAQHQCVQNAEDCRVGADGERQRQDCANGEHQSISRNSASPAAHPE